MRQKPSFNEVWQAMLRGRRIARRCAGRALEAYLRFHAGVSGRRIMSSGRNFVLTT